MPFSLTNALAVFQKFINHVLREYIDICCVVYIDDILIFSDNPEQYAQYVRKILETLAKANLFIKGEKCEFFTTSTTFLRFIISLDGISIDPAKVKAVQD